MLGKLPVPGRPTYLDYRRARAYCTCNRCGWGLLDIFSLLSPSLWETSLYRLKYCLKGPLNPEQPTNQPTNERARCNEKGLNVKSATNFLYLLTKKSYRQRNIIYKYRSPSEYFSKQILQKSLIHSMNSLSTELCPE